MFVSIDRDRIPRKKKRETTRNLNKITQDPENMSKGEKVGSSIEVKKPHQY